MYIDEIFIQNHTDDYSSYEETDWEDDIQEINLI